MTDLQGHPSTDLAMQLLREGKVDECLKCLDRVVTAYPENALAYSIMGAAYAKVGDRAMAIGAFEKAVAEEESPKTHTNLGKAYESAGRVPDAMRQYELALQIDPFYQQAAEGFNRLKPPDDQEVTVQGDAPHAHQLVSDDGARQADPSGLQPVGVPTLTPPPSSEPRAPDLRDLEARVRATDEKARETQKQMLKSGLTYGISIGLVGFVGTALLASLAFVMPLNITFAAISGILVGGIVGGWIGFTSGDDWTGAKTGALVGFIGLGLLGIKGGIIAIVILGIGGAFVGGAAGFIIGGMVSNSIGWD